MLLRASLHSLHVCCSSVSFFFFTTSGGGGGGGNISIQSPIKMNLS